MINIIVAHCKNRGIGMSGKLPWYLPADLKRFKQLTCGNGTNGIIMGRKTWDSLPVKPLKYRRNIIISKTMSRELNPHLIIKRNLHDAIEYGEYSLLKEIWIIGGSDIYNSAMKEYHIDNIHVTEIDTEFDCDRFLDPIPPNYKIKQEGEWKKTDYFKYRYVHYVNKTKPPFCKRLGYCM